MSAYSRRLIATMCGDCIPPKPATDEVRNGRNELVGFRCTKHAAALVKRLNDYDTPKLPGVATPGGEQT